MINPLTIYFELPSIIPAMNVPPAVGADALEERPEVAGSLQAASGVVGVVVVVVACSGGIRIYSLYHF